MHHYTEKQKMCTHAFILQLKLTFYKTTLEKKIPFIFFEKESKHCTALNLKHCNLGVNKSHKCPRTFPR